MYGLTRGVFTLVGAALSGFLVWLAFEVASASLGDYWSAIGLLAAAGLTMALSQLLGGWTKWGWPRISGSVFLLGFLPALLVVLWVVLASQPENGWLEDETRDWAGDIGLGGLLRDLGRAVPVLAYGLGLVFGLTFDTTGPRTEPLLRRRRVEEEREPPPAVPPTSHPLAAADVTEPAPAQRDEPEERPGGPAPGAREGEPPPPRRDEP